jgi:hypothetical protein
MRTSGNSRKPVSATAEEHNLVFHFHTSAGGSSDINNFIPLVERYDLR